MDTQKEIIYSRKLKKLTRKVEKTLSHIRFLKECISMKLVPYGFQVNWHPAFVPSTHSAERIHQTLRNASLNLMEDTMEQYISICNFSSKNMFVIPT